MDGEDQQLLQSCIEIGGEVEVQRRLLALDLPLRQDRCHASTVNAPMHVITVSNYSTSINFDRLM